MGMHIEDPLGKFNSVSMDTSVGTQYPVIFSHFTFIFNILSKIKLLYADSLLKIQVGMPISLFSLTNQMIKAF